MGDTNASMLHTANFPLIHVHAVGSYKLGFQHSELAHIRDYGHALLLPQILYFRKGLRNVEMHRHVVFFCHIT